MNEVWVREVGPRDGLQNESTLVGTAAKVELIEALSRTGLRNIQATSFVSPRAVPQMADADEVMAQVRRSPECSYSALVPNVRGVERAIAAGMDAVELVVSVSESHSVANTRMSTEDAFAQAARGADLCRAAGVGVEVGLATALGCPFEGLPSMDRLKWAVTQAAEGCQVDTVALADTVGMADPGFTTRAFEMLAEAFPAITFSFHPHNTRNMALANVYAALQVGIRRFDSSVAGLGGCPFAPGASGNVATEDLVNMLHALGYQTGVDLPAVIEVAKFARELVGHDESGVLRAGPTPLATP